jgi:hypothetical protein
VPADIAATCQPITEGTYPGTVETVQCLPSSVAVAYYALFADESAMDGLLTDMTNVQAPNAEEDVPCQSPDGAYGDVTYTDGTTGRYLCHPGAAGATWLWWTSDATNVIAYAATTGTDVTPMLAWWATAGPTTGAIGEVPPVDPVDPEPPVDPELPVDPEIPPFEPEIPPVEPEIPPIDPGQPPVDPSDWTAVCYGPDPAPLTVNDLFGGWGYDLGTWYTAEDFYFANVTGTFQLGTDMRWDGSRDVSYGGTTMVSSHYGPGTWSLDGGALTLFYDDGSDADTFDKIRMGVSETTGNPTMSLQVSYEDGSCLIYKLARVSY